MRFENEDIRIAIEKKQLNEQQKEERRLRRKKRRPVVIIACSLLVAIISGTVFAHLHTVHTGKENVEAYGQVEGEYVATSKLATGLQEKYADKSLYDYTYDDPIEDVGREEAITFQLGYDVADLGVEKWTEIFALYEDPELTRNIGVKFSFDAETKTFIMEPSETSVPCRISTRDMDVDTVAKYPHNVYYLFGNGAGTSWGNLGTAYLASYRDKETGVLLEKPEVSIVTFKGEIEEAPKLSYSITEDGRPEFHWNEVEGADEYMVCRTSRTGERGYDSLTVLGITEGTSWTTEPAEFASWATTNKPFRTYTISEDDWKDESLYEMNLEKYGEPGVPHYESGEYAVHYGICVVAVNQEGSSMISNVFNNEELAPNLPYGLAFYTEKENGVIHRGNGYESVESLPTYDYVTMCDGYTVTKLIEYDTENAYVQDQRFMILDEETGEVTGGETLPCLNIPYHVQGTPFYYEFSITDYDEANFQKDMAFLADREAKLSKKSGDIAPEFSLQFATQEDLKPEKIRKVDTEVVANSALSEYLAINMLGGVNVIDLSDFPEAADQKLVDDAFMEAYYQNPLILGIKGYRISKKGTALRVVYEESLENQAKKQQEIQEKVSEIIDEIITDDMTDREKELAINQYLCDTIVYDEDALTNAEEHDFMYTDEEFNDSFNAYGALINGKCVCAGYAAAFHLLAQETGLESVVVTGFLDGSLAHAWNKIKIDGEWQIVDVTNNDNEYFYNALLNLPSSVGNRVLVEDKDYVMDKLIPEYTGESDANEYYHITENYFPAEEVAQKLSTELAENGEVTLRTDYELNDSQFYEITNAVYEIMGDDIDLYGYYWLGVIYLTTEGEK